MSSPLLPPERMALLLATEQIKRRENPSPNITAVLIMALARLVDKLGDEETQLQAIADAWDSYKAISDAWVTSTASRPDEWGVLVNVLESNSLGEAFGDERPGLDEVADPR